MVEQLVVEQEFAAAGIARPGYGITGWVILTLIQYATDDQVAGCSLRSTRRSSGASCSLSPTPVRTLRASRPRHARGRGWLVNGQKVWTSGAHVAGMGFATVRTNP